MKRDRTNPQSGFSIVELIAVLGFMTLIMGIGITYLTDFESKAETGALEISRFVRQVRARAMAATLAYEIAPIDQTRIGVGTASTCSGPFSGNDNSLILDLPKNVELDSLGWDICFNSRGIPDGNITVSVTDLKGVTQSVEVMLGGGVRIY